MGFIGACASVLQEAANMSMNKIQMPSPLLEGLQDINFLGSIFADTERRFNDVDYRPAMTDTEGYLRETHETHFDERKSPVGELWPPLAALTVSRKGHDRPLIETDQMRQSILEPDHPSHIGEILERGMSFGTDDEKAAFHQFGTRRIPQREFVGMNDGQVTEVVDRTADEAVAALVYHR